MENGVYIGKALVRMVFAVLHCHNRMNGDTINHVCTQKTLLHTKFKDHDGSMCSPHSFSSKKLQVM